MYRLLAFILTVFVAHAGELTHDELLARIRARTADILSRLPNYTCRETIGRKIRRAAASQFENADLVRLEVSYVGGRELFAWPGSPRFEDKDMREFVASGLSASGNFGSSAAQVFSGAGPIFTWTGQYSRDGRTQVEFAFQVPLEASDFQLSHGGTKARVAYRGSFSADAETYDLVDFEVEAQNIPPRLELFQARQRTAYARSRISDSDYLLPRVSEVTAYDTNGEVDQNQVTFDSCHEYRGQSTISFEAPEASGAPAAAAASRKALPAGITLHLQTMTPIERGVTAIGDTVAAKLADRIQTPPIPAGAVATLRIVRMQPYPMGDRPGYLVGFELLGIESGGQKYDATGSLEGAKGPNASKWDRKGRVAFSGSNPVSPGLRLTWRTTDLR